MKSPKVSTTIIQEIEKEQCLLYYVNKVQDAETRYQKIKKVALAIEAKWQNKEWTLSVDDSSNQKGTGARIILKGPGRVLVKQSLCFNFQASNNQVVYKALLTRIRLAKEVGVGVLVAMSDSQLVTSFLSMDKALDDP
ncbi:hypothetical protein CR513_61598, partial [Mucuna pruriens]